MKASDKYKDYRENVFQSLICHLILAQTRGARPKNFNKLKAKNVN
jgi:hypothetical protein